MNVVLYHRTSIAAARQILKDGFNDTEWDFGLRDASTDEDVVVAGVWLSNRPLAEAEGPPGDALLEVTLELPEEQLQPFELNGMLWNARLWVVPADTLNDHSTTKMVRVDPRSSWGYDRIGDEGLPEDPSQST
jgi:hypothetical protein